MIFLTTFINYSSKIIEECLIFNQHSLMNEGGINVSNQDMASGRDGT
jgi:hypothetical protein